MSRSKLVLTLNQQAIWQSIEERPEVINLRLENGHYEIDTVLLTRVKNHCLLVLTDHRSRHQIIRPIPNKTTESVNQALEGILREHRILLMVQNFVVWLKCFLRSISTMRIPTLHGRGERMKITID